MKTPFLFLLPLLALTPMTRAELGFSFSSEEQVPFGNDLHWSVAITNDNDAPKTVGTSFVVRWLQYNGMTLATISEIESTNAVPAYGSTNLECRIPVSVYRQFLAGSETFECSACAWNVADEDEEGFERMRSFVDADDSLEIHVSPDSIPETGEPVDVMVVWTNSTPFAMSARVSLATSGCFTTFGGGRMISWPPTNVLSGEVMMLQTNLVVQGTGEPVLSVHLTSDSYPRLDKEWKLENGEN